MSITIAAPELMTAVARDLARIASSLSEANAAAASTTEVIATGDQVPAAIAQAVAFHVQFVHVLNAGAESSASAQANVAAGTGQAGGRLAGLGL